ncbi:MAG TPA: hypothetical protein DCQ28_11495 [Bacteroidetes bacterium]|nr:hypothetical protein [Bacteroidota bacterium]
MMISAIGCDKTITGSTLDDSMEQYSNNPEQDGALMLVSLDEIASDSLSIEEGNGLLYMREEEKLARDVYTELYVKWNLRPFSNITRSEQMHMNAILSLLTRYSLQDPVDVNGAGVFKNEGLQNLYNALIVEGNKSVVDALNVGATIEEVDIVDLQKHLRETDNQDITFVYDNLLRGSRNHLRAFVKNIKAQGVTYVPQYLTAAEYEQIISTPMERGR